MEVTEIIVGGGEARRRFILVRNPQEEARDRAKREEVLKALEEELKVFPVWTRRSTAGPITG